MASHHQYLSPYQQGIVSRFFAHRDTALRRRLAELVSEVYVTAEPTALEKLWAKARATMLKAGCDPAHVEGVCEGRKVEALARIVSELERAPAAKRAGTSRAEDDRFA
ncbi:MAG: hypothetical protein DYG92_14480 [Leptolyngbya sp. PLA1]|nr:hypothetical protein [Leptolyngbya sp. PLA1]